VLYYLVYNPEFWQRDGHQPFEVYKLVNGVYALQNREPFWMPEVGLGIGRCQMPFGNLMQEQLTWFDSRGDRCLGEAEIERQRAEAERQQAEAERQRSQRLLDRLRQLGEDI
jgi:hypothetical protein